MEGYFVAPVHLSGGVQIENVAPVPNGITNNEVFDANVLNNKRNDAQLFTERVKRARNNSTVESNITARDLMAAKDYETKTVMAQMVPNMLEQMPVINIENSLNTALVPIAAQLAQLTAQLTAQLAQQSAQFAQQFAAQSSQLVYMNTKQSNATARLGTDTIIAPHVPGNNAPGNNFPTTIQELLGLTAGPVLIEIENYYDLPHTNALPTRIARLRRAYGIVVVYAGTTEMVNYI